MDDLVSQALTCPSCDKPINVTYRHDPAKEGPGVPSRFECPWCHLNAVLYLPGWIVGRVTKQPKKSDGEAGMIRLVVPRLKKPRARMSTKPRSAGATKPARTRKRRETGHTAQRTKRRKSGAHKTRIRKTRSGRS